MRIIGFVCRDSALVAAEQAGAMGRSIPSSATLVEMPCTGRVDAVHILRAFREGADAVFVAGCLEGNCRYQYGNIEARKRVTLTKSQLQAAGLEPERLEMFNLASNQEWRFEEIVKEMVSRVEKLGPNPIGKVKT
ncbi:MAG TPA: hydrogenase iron-sulfur subunit [Methanomassiliicoccales archaeon]|jgi:coenzyme F420-reducing hydrogenase delta subunit